MVVLVSFLLFLVFRSSLRFFGIIRLCTTATAGALCL